MLRKVDRMTMAHSVEGRSPFCSASVLALADRIPYSMMKGDSSVLKKTLRKAYSDILSPQIISTPKHGFNVPIDKWLKNQWKDLLEDTFSKNSALASEGIISARSRDNAFEMLEQTNRLNGHTLFCFIMLNLWLEKSYGNYC
jgi:asparagine synthase (glutamine-hydrolysing)